MDNIEMGMDSAGDDGKDAAKDAAKEAAKEEAGGLGLVTPVILFQQQRLT